MVEGDHLHLGSPVLEPELDLAWFEAKFLAQFHPLLVVWVRAFFKQTVNRNMQAKV